MKEEKVSIIIPIYKVEKYLPRCVNSVLNQEYNNLEIILVDDGSPDRCGEICDNYAYIDSRIKIIHKKNGGLSDARNAGLEIATGEYISFLDSDDWIHEKYIQTLYYLLKKYNSDISVCNFMRTDDENVKLDFIKENIYEYTSIEALEQLCGKFYVQLVISWGKLYKKSLFKTIRFPYGKIHEDEFTTYKLLYSAKKIVLTEQPLLYYWQREDSIMGEGFKLKNKLNVIEAYTERADFFEKNDLLTLRDYTNKTMFFQYKTILEKTNWLQNIEDRKLIINNFRNLKKNLNKGKSDFKFQLFYKVYYFAPKISTYFLKIRNKLKIT